MRKIVRMFTCDALLKHWRPLGGFGETVTKDPDVSPPSKVQPGANINEINRNFRARTAGIEPAKPVVSTDGKRDLNQIHRSFWAMLAGK